MLVSKQPKELIHKACVYKINSRCDHRLANIYGLLNKISSVQYFTLLLYVPFNR